MKTRFDVRRLHAGQQQGASTPEERIIAVIRGRVDIEVAGADEPAVHLRSSDALRIPAQSTYRIAALQDSELLVYSPAEKSSPALWGV